MQRFRHALTPARALLLAAVLLLAQAAGLAHRVAHGGPAAASMPAVPGTAGTVGAVGPRALQAHGHAFADAAAHTSAQGGRAGHGVGSHGLTEHELAGAECRLFDQLLGHADLLPASAPAGDLLRGVDSPCAAATAAAGTTTAAPYQARAPPLG